MSRVLGYGEKHETPLCEMWSSATKDDSAKSLLPFEVYLCRNCGDGLFFEMTTKEAYLIPKNV